MGRARSERLAPANGAGNEGRTRDLKLGKLALCQLSYTRVNPFYPSRTSAIKHNNQILSRTSTSTSTPTTKRSSDLAAKQESLMLSGPTIWKVIAGAICDTVGHLGYHIVISKRKEHIRRNGLEFKIDKWSNG
jgi:hypothetical protein